MISKSAKMSNFWSASDNFDLPPTFCPVGDNRKCTETTDEKKFCTIRNWF